MGDTTGTSYVYRGATSGTKYTFTIRPMDKDAKSYLSGYDAAGASITYIAPPVITKLHNTNKGIQVTWAASKGAVNYRVFYRQGTKGSWSVVGDTTGTTIYTKDKLTGNTLYNFTVRAIAADARSYASSYDPNGKSITYLDAPKLVSANVGNNGITVTWNKVPGAEQYRVFYKNSKNQWTKAADTTGTSAVIKRLAFGRSYTFTVRCMNEKATTYTSGYDAAGISVANLDLPVFTVAAVQGGAVIKWDAVDGAAKYRVYCRQSGQSAWTALTNTTATSYQAKNLKSKTAYTFTVRCISADGKAYTSGYLNGITLTTK